MKTILGILFFLVSNLSAWAQTTVLADNSDDGCRIKFEKIKAKIDARRKKYEFNVQEYREGLFCSECRRTKSEIEERAHLNFYEHIKEGADRNRHTLIATQAIYDHLFTEYLSDYNNLKEEYDNQYADCGGDGNSAMLPTVTGQQLQIYTTQLNGNVNTYNTGADLVRTDYFYYSWIMKITITRWQITHIETARISSNTYQANSYNTGNAITKAGNLLNDYLLRLAEKQREDSFLPNSQLTQPVKETLAIKQ